MLVYMCNPLHVPRNRCIPRSKHALLWLSDLMISCLTITPKLCAMSVYDVDVASGSKFMPPVVIDLAYVA